MSTEIRFTSGSFSEVAGDAQRLGGDIAAERDHGAGRPRGPLGPQRVDVDLHVVGRRVARRQVLGLDLRSAARAVELQDPAPGRVRGEGELVAAGSDQGAVGLAGIAIVDQRAFLVVAARRAEVVAAAPAAPPLGFQVDLEILGHRDAHHGAHYWPLSVSRRSPAAVVSNCQPAGTRMVKNGPSITAGPCPCAPGRCCSSAYTGTSARPPRPSRSDRVPPDWAGEAPGSPSAPIATCGSGASSTSSREARSPGFS